jgi:hypothetical protein
MVILLSLQDLDWLYYISQAKILKRLVSAAPWELKMWNSRMFVENALNGHYLLSAVSIRGLLEKAKNLIRTFRATYRYLQSFRGICSHFQPFTTIPEYSTTFSATSSHFQLFSAIDSYFESFPAILSPFPPIQMVRKKRLPWFVPNDLWSLTSIGHD